MARLPLVIDIERPAPLVFATREDATDWIEKEISSWEWLSDDKAHQVSQFLGSYPSDLKRRLNLTRNKIAETFDSADTEAIISAFRGLYVGSRYPLSSDPIAILAKELADGGDSAAAASAVATHIGRIQFQNQMAIPPDVLRGVVVASLLSVDLGPLVPKAITESLRRAADEFTSRSAKAETRFAEQVASFESQARDWDTRLLQNEAEVLNKWTDKIEDSIKSIKATDAAYSDLMRLKASVDYWTKKAKEHRLAEKQSKKNLIKYAGFGTAILVGSLVGLAILANHFTTSEHATATSLKFAAVGAVITTIALWVGRVLLRIFLSERHLATDAEERVTMVMTYLALTNEDKLAEGDRSLVLVPLFRPAADGIVKEDSAPDTTLAAIIARGLDRNAPGR